MAKTEAELQVMEKTAHEFETVNGQLQKMLTNLMHELAPLRQKWQGAGGRSFEQVKQSFEADQQTINKMLLETAGAIRTAGQGYHATDTATGDNINKVQGQALNLPL